MQGPYNKDILLLQDLRQKYDTEFKQADEAEVAMVRLYNYNSALMLVVGYSRIHCQGGLEASLLKFGEWVIR